MPERNLIMFRVDGKPQPAGSKRAFTIKRRGMAGNDAKHFRSVVIDDNTRSKPWQYAVQMAARAVFKDHPWEGPLAMTLTFTIERPKSHYGSGRNAEKLKQDAPVFPMFKPDSTKLCRGVEDALTGVLWRDDSQIVTQTVHKRYGREGVTVEVWKQAPVSHQQAAAAIDLFS